MISYMLTFVGGILVAGICSVLLWKAYWVQKRERVREEGVRFAVASNYAEVVQGLIGGCYIGKSLLWECANIVTTDGGPLGSEMKILVLRRGMDQITLSDRGQGVKVGDRVTLKMSNPNDSWGVSYGFLDRYLVAVRDETQKAAA